MGVRSKYLSFGFETCYGSLTLFTTILHNVFLLYHVDTFVSVYRIDKVSFWFGEAIFLAWNSLNDPLFGWISDSKLLQSEKHESSNIILTRLSALHTFGPLFAVSFCLFWFNWAMPGLQFTVCLCLYDGFLTMIDLHHSALLADISVSGDTRTRLNSKCSIFSAIGSLSVFLSYQFWDKSNIYNFRVFCFVLAAISFFGYYFTVKFMKLTHTAKMKSSSSSLKEITEDTNDEHLAEHEHQASISKFGKQLFSHKNFLWFNLMNLIQVFHCHFNSNFFPLFLDTLLGEAFSPAMASILLGLSFVAPHINNLYFLSLCRKFGVYSVIQTLFFIKLGLSLVMFVTGPSWIWLLSLFISSNRVFTEGTCKLLSLVISDLVDEDMVLHGRPQAVSALVFGTSALLSKPGQTLAPVIGTWILAQQTGHDIFQSGKDSGSMKLDLTHMDKESQMMYKTGVFTVLICVPVFCALLQLIAWSQFTLKGHRLAQVKAARLALHQITV